MRRLRGLVMSRWCWQCVHRLFQGWRTVFQGTRCLRSSAIILSTRCKGRVISNVLEVWHILSSDHRRRFQSALKGVRRWIASTVQKSFNAWSKGTSERKRLDRAAHRIASSYLSRAIMMRNKLFCAWSSTILERKSREARLARLLCSRSASLKRRFWNELHSFYSRCLETSSQISSRLAEAEFTLLRLAYTALYRHSIECMRDHLLNNKRKMRR